MYQSSHTPNSILPNTMELPPSQLPTSSLTFSSGVDSPVVSPITPPIPPISNLTISSSPTSTPSDSTSTGYTKMNSQKEFGSDMERHLDAMTLSSRVRSSDVFLSLSSCNPSVLRFTKWLRAELEMHGIPCFVSDRSRCRDEYENYIAQRAMDAAPFGVVVLTKRSFSSGYVIEEMRVFSRRKKLVPIFFGIPGGACTVKNIVQRRGELWERDGGGLWTCYGGSEEEWREAIGGLSRVDLQLEANSDNFRSCIFEVVSFLGARLGRTTVVENIRKWRLPEEDEFPMPRNINFVGRDKEIHDLELLLFGEVEGDRAKTKTNNLIIGERVEESRRKGKKTMLHNEDEDRTEILRGEKSSVSTRENQDGGDGKKNNTKAIVCIFGDSGIGKTELLLEFAYRYFQRYQKILWVGGEGRYVGHNFMKLLSILGFDLAVEDELLPAQIGSRTFEEREEEAVRKVQKELTRDVPYLLLIDNLDNEKDWWTGKSIMELLRPLGKETHVIISTCLQGVTNIESLRLLHLSRSEAISLMKGEQTNLDTEESNALGIIEKRLGRLPLGLAIVGAFLSEVRMNPSKLLDIINNTPCGELASSSEEDHLLKKYSFLTQVLDLCFSMFHPAEKPRKLAMKMVEASGWFGPAPIEVSTLALAATKVSEKHHGEGVWRKCTHMLSCISMPHDAENVLNEGEASSMLVRSHIARNCTKQGYIFIHDIIKLYARKIGDDGVARSMVRALGFRASVSQDSNHIWAACFLLFKFGREPVSIDVKPSDLVSLIKRCVLPLALDSFSSLSRCTAATELLRLSTEALGVLEGTPLTGVRSGQNIFSDPLLYQDIALLRATLLETSAKLMLKGGEYDIGERLCRSAVSIKEVMYGLDHSETQSARETLDRINRLRLKF